MNIITCIPNLLILFGSFLMAVFPLVMSGYGTSQVEWPLIHLRIGKIVFKNITYGFYWAFSWGLIILGTILQLCFGLWDK